MNRKKAPGTVRDRSGGPRTPRNFPRNEAEGPSLEAILFLGAIVLGLFARLFLIDQRPLTLEEGSLAARAYRLMLGQTGEAFSDGALATYATALSLGLFGGGDGAARLVSSVVGVALVGGPYLLRSTLGRSTALIAAYMFSLSPVLLFASRTVGSGIIPAVLSLILWWSASEETAGKQWRPYAIALALAGLLASGTAGVTAALALGLAALLSHPDPGRPFEQLRAASGSRVLRRAVLLFAATALLLSIGLGFNPGGVQAVLVDSWTGWLSSISLTAPRGGLLGLLALYELPVLALALARLTGTLLRRERTDMLLSLWAMVLLLIGMLQPGEGLSRLVLAAVPVYLLGARALAGALPLARTASFSWRWVAGAIALSSPMLVAMVMLNRSTILAQEIPQEYLYGEVALVVAAILAFLVVVPSQQRASLALCALVVLAAGLWLHTSVFLNYRQASAPSEILAGPQLSPQLRQLAQDSAYYSTHYNSRVVVDPQLRPYLEWYLRGAKNVEYSQESSQGISIALAQGAASAPAEGSERAPGIYLPALESRGFSWQGLWGWAMSRDGMVRQNPRDIIFRTPTGIW